MWGWLRAAIARASRFRAGPVLRFAGPGGRQDFHCDVVTQGGILCAIDLAHAAVPINRLRREASSRRPTSGAETRSAIGVSRNEGAELSAGQEGHHLTAQRLIVAACAV